MNKEEAKSLFREVDAYGKPKAVMTKVGKICNEYEKDINKLKNKIRDCQAFLTEREEWELLDAYNKHFKQELEQ